MASLMFRAKANNPGFAEAKRPSGPGTRTGHIVSLFYDLRGGLLGPDKELKRSTIRAFRLNGANS